jgi:hypothetical protein
MKRKFMYLFGFVAAGLLALGSNPAAADAVGPYYATPSWDQQLPGATRFVVLSNWGGAAVLDRETALVWERSPSTSTFDWLGAQRHCNQPGLGNRLGWRLPTLQELASLVDPTVASPPKLPAGHPFTNVQPSGYWSATTLADLASDAWVVDFGGGTVNNGGGGKLNNNFVWCVRGGQGVDPQ